MRHPLTTLIVCGLVMTIAMRSASAIPLFKKGFEKHYISDKTNEDFTKKVKSNKTGCFLCHQGKKRKNLNPYGEELAKLLDKKKDAKNKEKILESLKKVGKIHTDPKDKKSPTYEDRIKKNQFPGGPLEEVQKEPKKEGDKGDSDGANEDSESEGKEEGGEKEGVEKKE